MEKKVLKGILKGMEMAILVAVALPLVALIGAIPTYFLWNWLMPDLFGLSHLTFWQAWGIFWLANSFFGSKISRYEKSNSKAPNQTPNC